MRSDLLRQIRLYALFVMLGGVFLPFAQGADRSTCLRSQLEKLSHHFHTGDKKWTDDSPSNPVALILDEINAGKIPEAVGKARIVEAAKVIFRERNIAFLEATNKDGTKHLRVLTRPRDPALPRNALTVFAKGMLKYDPRFEMIYDPSVLGTKVGMGISAQYEPSSQISGPKIYIGHDEVMKDSIRSPSMVHELIHAKVDRDSRGGKLYGYTGYVQYFPTPGRVRGFYDRYMNFDELISFQSDLADATRKYVLAQQKGEHDLPTLRGQFINQLYSNILLSERAGEAARLARVGLSQLTSTGGLEKGTSELFKWEGFDYQASSKVSAADGGKRWVTISIAALELDGAGRSDLVPFQVHYPIQAPGALDFIEVARILESHLDEVQVGAIHVQQTVRAMLDIFGRLNTHEAISTQEREAWLKQLREISRSRLRLPR